MLFVLGRIMSIVDGLRSSNEIRQSEAASELAEMLLLGNEESLPNMPVRDIIQCLMMLLQKDHNFELVRISNLNFLGGKKLLVEYFFVKSLLNISLYIIFKKNLWCSCDHINKFLQQFHNKVEEKEIS